MRIIASQFAVGCALWLLICPVARAKRKPPEPVPPVVSGDVRYSVGGNGTAQSIVASAVGSGAVLWRVEVFRTKIYPRMEKDVPRSSQESPHTSQMRNASASDFIGSRLGMNSCPRYPL